MTSSQSTAGGQYLGYSLQLSRLLALLLQGRTTCSVALEELGDLAVLSQEGPERVEELKSRTSAGNPISDRAIDLWKTLKNWLDLIDSGVDPDLTEFVLRTSKEYTSHFAAEFHNVSDPETANKVIVDIQAFFTATPPEKTLSPFVRAVLQPERAQKLAALLCNMRLEHGSGASADELLELLARTAVPEEHRHDVLQALCGWLKLTTDKALEAGHSAVVSVAAFHNELIALVRKYDRRAVLQTYSRPPAQEELEAQKGRTFVRQVALVEDNDLMRMRAVTDYLRSRAERIQWTARTLLHESDFDSLQEELEAAWHSKKAIVDVREGGRPEKDRGRLLLHECLLHRCRIQGMETPPHFTPGSFHALADELIIGWHPSYGTLLNSQEGE